MLQTDTKVCLWEKIIKYVMFCDIMEKLLRKRFGKFVVLLGFTCFFSFFKAIPNSMFTLLLRKFPNNQIFLSEKWEDTARYTLNIWKSIRSFVFSSSGVLV